MTKQIEIVDALPGCGKTHAIFDHIGEHSDRPWLYLTPALAELVIRVPKEAQRAAVDFFIPNEKEDTKSEQVLKALRNRENIACTHSLMLRFQREHIEALVIGGYNVVCDEELNLIQKFEIRAEDVDFLLKHNLIGFDPTDGRVSFLDKGMSLDARYGNVKQLADMGCLYAAKRSNKMLVTQISPELVDAANRFILLTYQYQGSIMQTFMKMHGYTDTALNILLRFSVKDVKEGLRELIEFVETPSIKSVQEKYSLSKSWWDIASTEKDREAVVKAMRSAITKTKVDKKNVFYTLPKNRVVQSGKALVDTQHLKKENFLSCSTRSTCEYDYKELAIHAYALHPPVAVKSYLQDQGFTCSDDTYALNMLIQWLFRGRIRNKEKMKVSILSRKMSALVKEWLLKK